MNESRHDPFEPIPEPDVEYVTVTRLILRTFQSRVLTLSIDEAAKLLAGFGLVLYGILFLAYRAYYSSLSIDPEDIGITSSFLLVRSVSLALLVLVLSPIIASVLSGTLAAAGSFARKGWSYRVTYLILVAASVCFFVFSRV